MSRFQIGGWALILGALAACQASPLTPGTAPTPSPTAAPTSTPSPTATMTLSPTATSTPTPLPTATETPTPPAPMSAPSGSSGGEAPPLPTIPGCDLDAGFGPCGGAHAGDIRGDLWGPERGGDGLPGPDHAQPERAERRHVVHGRLSGLRIQRQRRLELQRDDLCGGRRHPGQPAGLLCGRFPDGGDPLLRVGAAVRGRLEQRGWEPGERHVLPDAAVRFEGGGRLARMRR